MSAIQQAWLDALGIPVWLRRQADGGVQLHWLERGESGGQLWLLGPASLELWYRQNRVTPRLLSLWQALGLVGSQQSLVLVQPDPAAACDLKALTPWPVAARIGLGLELAHWLPQGSAQIVDDQRVATDWQARQRLCWQLWPLKRDGA